MRRETQLMCVREGVWCDRRRKVTLTGGGGGGRPTNPTLPLAPGLVVQVPNRPSVLITKSTFLVEVKILS